MKPDEPDKPIINTLVEEKPITIKQNEKEDKMNK